MTDYADLIARLREAHANSPQRIAGSMIFDEAAAAIAALTAERDALQAHIAQEAEFLATVTAAKHEAEREVERLRDILDEAPAHISTETLDAIRRNARKAAAAQDKAVREWSTKP